MANLYRVPVECSCGERVYVEVEADAGEAAAVGYREHRALCCCPQDVRALLSRAGDVLAGRAAPARYHRPPAPRWTPPAPDAPDPYDGFPLPSAEAVRYAEAMDALRRPARVRNIAFDPDVEPERDSNAVLPELSTGQRVRALYEESEP